MTQVTIHQPLGPHAVVARDALAANLGRPLQLYVEGGTVTEARIVGVKVDDDGHGFALTLDVDDAVGGLLVTPSLPGSFTVEPDPEAGPL